LHGKGQRVRSELSRRGRSGSFCTSAASLARPRVRQHQGRVRLAAAIPCDGAPRRRGLQTRTRRGCCGSRQSQRSVSWATSLSPRYPGPSDRLNRAVPLPRSAIEQASRHLRRGRPDHTGDRAVTSPRWCSLASWLDCGRHRPDRQPGRMVRWASRRPVGRADGSRRGPGSGGRRSGNRADRG